jgi:hypothetical protein
MSFMIQGPVHVCSLSNLVYLPCINVYYIHPQADRQLHGVGIIALPYALLPRLHPHPPVVADRSFVDTDALHHRRQFAACAGAGKLGHFLLFVAGYEGWVKSMIN